MPAESILQEDHVLGGRLEERQRWHHPLAEELPALAATAEFAKFAEEIVPRVHDLLQQRLWDLLDAPPSTNAGVAPLVAPFPRVRHG